MTELALCTGRALYPHIPTQDISHVLCCYNALMNKFSIKDPSYRSRNPLFDTKMRRKFEYRRERFLMVTRPVITAQYLHNSIYTIYTICNSTYWMNTHLFPNILDKFSLQKALVQSLAILETPDFSSPNCS